MVNALTFVCQAYCRGTLIRGGPRGGTRIPVENILRKLSQGATEADLLDTYPRLTHDDVQAALRYGADAVAHEVIVLPRAV